MTNETGTKGALVALAVLLLAGISIGQVSLSTAGEVSGATVRPAPEGFSLQGDAKLGRRIYKQYCQKCHGKKGDGNGLMARNLDPKPRDFTNKEDMAKRSDWEIYLGIKEGGSAVGLSDEMAPWGDTLTDDEIRAVAVYIRQFAK